MEPLRHHSGSAHHDLAAERRVHRALEAFGVQIGCAGERDDVAARMDPCVGPALTAILMTAAGQETSGQGAWLLFFYGAGMTFPFVLAALFIGPFMKFMSRFRRQLGVVEKIMGILLIVFGLLIATNSVNIIGFWLQETFSVFDGIG